MNRVKQVKREKNDRETGNKELQRKDNRKGEYRSF